MQVAIKFDAARVVVSDSGRVSLQVGFNYAKDKTFWTTVSASLSHPKKGADGTMGPTFANLLVGGEQLRFLPEVDELTVVRQDADLTVVGPDAPPNATAASAAAAARDI